MPQGGNTGLAVGSVPDSSGRQVVLSLTRLNAVRAIDADNLTITVEAGCVLQHVQEAAEAAGYLFPLSLAAEGSCTLGGNLGTNAGGTQVVRYGNARELCLGLEVVTAQGEVWHGLSGLRKDNTGYDLRDLFIGSEGTLGIITAATLKLYPQPAASLTALASTQSLDQCVALLGRRTVGAVLTAAAVTSRFRTARCPGFDLPAFWRTAVASGIAAQTLALELGVDSGLAFTAGLLHDLGRLVLVARLPAAMGQALAWARLHDQPLQMAEQEVLGIDHAEAGALVARHWQLPPALVAAIGGHHGTAPAANPDHQALCDLVQAADAIVHALDLHHAEDERVPMLSPGVASRLDLTPARSARALAVTEQGVASLAEALAL